MCYPNPTSFTRSGSDYFPVPMAPSFGHTAIAEPTGPAKTEAIQPNEVRPPAARRRAFARPALLALAGLPAVLAIAEALRSPKLNFNDFWLVLGLTTSPSGTFEPARTLTLYNGHPIELVSVMFWLDAKFFAGSNVTLGLVSVLLAAGILAALWTMLPARLTGIERAAVLAALSALVFSSAAFCYFGVGMMGVQWLLGLGPAVVAMAFAQRGRTAPAVLFAALASLGHGSALPVWAALTLIAWLRRDRWWRVATLAAFGVLALVLWLVAPASTGYQKPALIGAESLLGTMLATLGKVWSAGSFDLAVLAGALTLGVLAALGWPAVRQRLRPSPVPVGEAGWFGLAVHMALAAAMIGLGRSGYGVTEGLASRYVAISLLFTCALLVLVVTRAPLPVRLRLVPIALIVALASYGLGSTNAADTRRQYPVTPTLAVAMRVDATKVISQLYGYPGYLDVLRSMRVYPFSRDFSLGCGGPELGDRVDLARAVNLPGPGNGRTTLGYVETASDVAGDTLLEGYAMIKGQQADCVLVVDLDGTVVGGGSVGLPRKDILTLAWGTGRSGWQVVAGPDTKAGAILVKYRGTYYRVGEGNRPPVS
jgi:hypothetical protein